MPKALHRASADYAAMPLWCRLLNFAVRNWKPDTTIAAPEAPQETTTRIAA